MEWSGKFLEERLEQLEVHGLGDVLVGAEGGEGLGLVLGRRERGGHDDHLYPRGGRVVLQAAAHLAAVHLGHERVQEENVGPVVEIFKDYLEIRKIYYIVLI